MGRDEPAAECEARSGARPRLIVLLAGLSAFVALSIDLALPALPDIGAGFRAGPGEAQRTMSAYFIGLAIGQLVYGPLSDRLGRRPPLLAGIALYVAASAGCALASSLDMLVAARFVQALGGCAGLVVSRAIVRDLFDKQETARILSLLTLIVGTAPILAPSLGVLVVEAAGWRAVFGLLFAFGLAFGAASLFLLDESRSAETERRARSETPLLALAALLRSREAMGYVLGGALNVACLLAYIAAAPGLIIETLGMPPGWFGPIFAVNAVGILAMTQVNRVLLERFPVDRVLRAAAIGAVPLSLLLLAGAAAGSAAGILVPLFLVIGSYGFVAANAAAGALSVDPLRAGAASALAGSASFAAGALASLLVGEFADGTAVPLAATIAGSLALSAFCLLALTSGRGSADL